MTLDDTSPTTLGPAPEDSPSSPGPASHTRNPAPLESREGFTALGRVLRPHGIRGELRVEAFAPGAPNMQPGRTVYLDGAPRKVLRARADRAAWILQLQGITDRDAAEACREYLIEAADDDVQRNDADSYFIHELVGLRVVTSDGRELGNLTEVIQSGAADVYVAEGPEGEVLFPAIAEVVEEINLREQFMRITPLPGLLDKSK